MTFFTWFMDQKSPRKYRQCGRRKDRGKKCPHRPALELLEDRLAPATVAWDGGTAGTGTAWNTAANWVGDVLPTAVDDVEIGSAFAGVTISSGGSVTINKLTSAATLSITSGAFS